MDGKMPPHDLAAERMVLGAVLRDPGVLPDVRGWVAADDFYHPAHGKLFAQLAGMADRDEPVDLVSVHAGARGWWEAGNLPGWLAEVFDGCPTAAGAEYHAGVVRDLAVRRRLVHTLVVLARDAQDGIAPVEQLLADAERAVLAVGDRLLGPGGPVALDDAVRAALERIDATATAGPAARVTTGFDALDQVIGGFRPGVLYVVAARPSVGKSALALAVLLNAGVPSLFVSLEMSAAELADRTLAVRASVDLGRIAAGRLADDEPRRLLDAAGRPTGVWVDDRADHTPGTIAAAVRRAVRRQGVRLVAVDYLQLVRHDRAERHDLRVGETAKALKRLARQCRVPVLCLAQLNRKVEERAEARPKLSDLRDSGEIEQDADVVILLHPEPFQPGDKRQRVTLCVEKQRNGPRTDVTLEYVRPFTRFEPKGLM